MAVCLFKLVSASSPDHPPPHTLANTTNSGSQTLHSQESFCCWKKPQKSLWGMSSIDAATALPNLDGSAASHIYISQD